MYVRTYVRITMNKDGLTNTWYKVVSITDKQITEQVQVLVLSLELSSFHYYFLCRYFPL